MRIVCVLCNKDAKKIIANAKKAGSKVYDFRPNHFSIETSKMEEQMIYNQVVDRYHRLDVILRSQVLKDEDSECCRVQRRLLTDRCHRYIIGDKSDKGQDASL